MARQKAAATILLSIVCGLSAWGQGAPTGCNSEPADNDQAVRTRTHITWTKIADGKSLEVQSPVKEMKIARVTFAGDPALPPPAQVEIAKSLRELAYDDNKDGVDELLERARDAWQHYGYFNVKVEHGGSQTLEEDSESRTVAITVNVDAGKQYRLDEIHFVTISADTPRRLPLVPAVPQGQLQFTAEQLRALLPVQQGDIFDTHKIQQGLEELRKAYGARGFINFTIVPSTQIDEESGRITLLVELDEGKQFRLGRVEVTGLDSEKLRKLLQDSGVVPGNVFDAVRYEDFARQSQEILRDFRAEDDVERRIHEESGTVDLTFHVRGCDAP
jgi:outer membrane protein assembly factor BamA